jgi:hypothetical protein
MELHEHYPDGKKRTSRSASWTAYTASQGHKSIREIRANDMKEFSAKFDLVMVFPMEGENKQQQTDACKHIVYEMLEAGLEIFTYLSVQDDELYCLIRAPVIN